MDAVKYLKEVYRMCSTFDKCESCPLSDEKTAFPCNATDKNVECEDPEKVVSIVEKWSEKHQVKTRKSEFLKMFPNVKLENNVIAIYPCKIDTRSDDLISRKALLNALENAKDKVYEGKTILEVMQEIIGEQKTAFDKEQVIEELQKNAEEARAYWQKYDCEDIHGLFRGYKNAIEIVKKGGIE